LGDGENGGQTEGVDLFGNPLQPFRDPRGRPQFAKTKENQLLVVQLKTLGRNHTEIAQFMGCTEKTLRKHFSRELEHGALFLQGMAMQVLVRRMLDGNVGAAREVLAMTQAAHAPKGKGAGEAIKPPKLGKKAMQDNEARQPPDSWGDLIN
jgi:hypothetical protein